MSSARVIDLASRSTPVSLPSWEFLRGGVMEIHVVPEQPPIGHRSISGLHGLVTALLRAEHTPMTPRFALFPWPRGIGWAIYCSEDDLALRVADRVQEARLWATPVLARLSSLRRVPAPRIRADSTIVVVRALTPITIRESAKNAKIQGRERKHRLDPGNVISTMAAWLPNRIGLAWPGCGGYYERWGLSATVKMDRTRPASVKLGGKLGIVHGFTGEWVMRCCPKTRWLLDAAQTVGLGGRTAYGFGRILVDDI